MSFLHSEINKWVEKQFNKALFSDKRRTKRIINIATKMAKYPGKSIPQLCNKFYDVKATYNIFKHSESTPEGIQMGHKSLVYDELKKKGEYLLTEDTSDMCWCGNDPIEGLGPIGVGSKGLQGFFLHTVLAVKWNFKELDNYIPLEILGIADQQYFIRQKKEKRTKTRRRLTTEDIESKVWEKALTRLPIPSAQSRCIRVCDRGADIYEVLRDSIQKGYGFIIRAQHNRVLYNNKYLLKTSREASSLGTYFLELRGRPNQPSRKAKLSISIQEVKILSPQRPGFARGKLSSVNCSVVRVWEINSNKNITPIEWILLTDKKITSFEEAKIVIKQYSRRWLIEEYHKAIKTGLGAEKLQLEKASRLFAAISIMSVIALRLVKFRDILRINSQKPASTSDLSKLELKILSKVVNRELKTLEDVNLAIGRLGGHLNRKNDGPPGMITLWRGMHKLILLIEGAQLMNDIKY